ncbi:MAG: response regulator [Bacillota bacterium]|jgi:PAS domain S-box-containing protein
MVNLTRLQFNQKPKEFCNNVVSSICSEYGFDSGLVVDFNDNSVLCAFGSLPAYANQLNLSELVSSPEFSVLALDDYLTVLGVKAAVAFPLFNEGKARGACLLLSQTPVSIDESLTHAAAGVSALLSMAIGQSAEHAEVKANYNEAYWSMFKNTNAVMLLIDPETGRIVDANPAACRYYGYTRTEFQEKRIQDINQMSEAEVRQEMQLAAENIRNHFAFKHRLANGELRDVEVYSGPINFNDTQVLYSIVHDVTEKNQAMEKLKESNHENQRLADNIHLLLNSSGEGIIGVDHLGRCTFVNRAACNMLQYTEEELLGKEIHVIIHHTSADGSERDIHGCPMQRTLTTGEGMVDNDEILWRKDGAPLNVRYSCCPMKENSTVVGAVITFTDITEQKAMIASLAESVELARSVAEGLSGQILVLDEDGRIIMANRAWQREYYRRYPDAAQINYLGRNYLELCESVPGELNKVGRLLAQGLREVISGKREQYDLEYKEDLSEETRYYLARVAPLSGKGRVIVTHEDLTKIVRSREVAEKASMAKSNFLACMSHEIRTPLNAIIGVGDLLFEQPLSEEQMDFVRLLRSAGNHLLSLVNNILDMSQIESCQFVLEETAFDLTAMVEDTLEFMAFPAHRKGLEVNVHFPGDFTPARYGDANRLQQVLVNLLGNAIRFTEQGEITLRVWERDSSEMVFELSDTGAGIPEDKLERIFMDFPQAEPADAAKDDYTNLGLPISLKMAEAMQGTIEVRSEVGKGSVFTLTVRLPISSHGQEEKPKPAVNLQGPVLIIDDNATCREILRELLDGQGTEVAVAPDGPSGLAELLRAQNANAPYQVVLEDRWLPGMDGFQVAESIKSMEIANLTLVMMLTTNQKIADVERCQALGIPFYLSKPVRRDELFRVIQLVSAGKVPVPQASEPVNTDDSEVQKRILVAEDSPDNQMLMRHFFKNTKYSIEIAENGIQAVEKVKQARYDLILMDIQMPNMDGLTATATIRKWEAEQNQPATPIIALTAYAFQEDIDMCLQAGCDAHLSKPVKKAELLELVAGWLAD